MHNEIFLCVFSIACWHNPAALFSWFLGLSLKSTLLLTVFPSPSWFHGYNFNEQNDYYQRIIYVSNAATWGKADSNLTGISGSLSFGFSIPLSRVGFFLCFFLYAILCSAFNQICRKIVVAVEKCASPANFHCCGKCAQPAVQDFTLLFPEMGSLSKTDWLILSAFILMLGLALVKLIFRTVLTLRVHEGRS